MIRKEVNDSVGSRGSKTDRYNDPPGVTQSSHNTVSQAARDLCGIRLADVSTAPPLHPTRRYAVLTVHTYEVVTDRDIITEIIAGVIYTKFACS